MCTAGRIKHHLKNNITDPRNTILFVGFQAFGTLGRRLIEGTKEVRIHGEHWPVKARVEQIHGFSGHGDQEDLLNWLGQMDPMPQRLFLTHGEMDGAQVLEGIVHQRWPHMNIKIPAYQHSVEL